MSEPTLTEWIRSNEPKPSMFWRDQFDVQVRDGLQIAGLMSLSDDEAERLVTVASTHTSKSITLPVYHLSLPDHGVDVWWRNNFHDVKVSVRAKQPLLCNFLQTFDRMETHLDCYCEGMGGLVFGSYRDNPREFTVALADVDLWVFFRVLRDYLGIGGAS